MKKRNIGNKLLAILLMMALCVPSVLQSLQSQAEDAIEETTEETNYADQAMYVGATDPSRTDSTNKDYSYDYHTNGEFVMPSENGVVLDNLTIGETFNMSATMNYSKEDNGTHDTDVRYGPWGVTSIDGFYLGTAYCVENGKTTGTYRHLYAGVLYGAGSNLSIWENDYSRELARAAGAAGSFWNTTELNYTLSYNAAAKNITITVSDSGGTKTATQTWNMDKVFSDYTAAAYSDFQFNPGVGNALHGGANKGENPVPATVSNIRIWGNITVDNPVSDYSGATSCAGTTNSHYTKLSDTDVDFGEANYFVLGATLTGYSSTSNEERYGVTIGKNSKGNLIQAVFRPNEEKANIGIGRFNEDGNEAESWLHSVSGPAKTDSYKVVVLYDNGKISVWVNGANYLKEYELTDTIVTMDVRIVTSHVTSHGSVRDVMFLGTPVIIFNYASQLSYTGTDGKDYSYEYHTTGDVISPFKGGILLDNLTIGEEFHMSAQYTWPKTENSASTDSAKKYGAWGLEILDGFYLGTATKNGKSANLYVGVHFLLGDRVSIWDGTNRENLLQIGKNGSYNGTEFTYTLDYNTVTGKLKFSGSYNEPGTNYSEPNLLTLLQEKGYTNFVFQPGIGNSTHGSENREAPATVSDIKVWGDIRLDHTYISVAQPQTNISGDVSLTRKIGSAEELGLMMNADSLPAGAVYTVDSSMNVLADDGTIITDFKNLLRLTGDKVLPILRVEDVEIIPTLKNYLDGMSFYDLSIVSENSEVLQAVQSQMPVVRRVLDLTGTYNEQLTSETCTAIRRAVYSSGANDTWLPASVCDKEMVQKLYDMQVDVWAVAEDELTEVACYNVLLSGAMGVVSDDTASLLSVACGELPENTISRMPAVLAHRGFSGPQNTIESAMNAYEHGIEAVEFDVLLTTDGVVVAMHDKTTTNTCTNADGNDVTLTVEESTWAQLQELYANKGYEKSENEAYRTCKIPRLEQYLEYVQDKDFHLYIEVKSQNADIVPIIKELVEEYGVYDKCTIKSFNSPIHEKMAEVWPEMPIAYIVDKSNNENGYLDDTTNANKDVTNLMGILGASNSYLHARKEGYGKEAVRATNLRGVNICLHGYPNPSGESGDLHKEDFLAGYYNILTDHPWGFGGRVMDISVDDVKQYVLTGSTWTPQVKLDHFYNSPGNADTKNIQVLSGAEYVTIENGTITFTGEGEVSLLFTCTNNYSGDSYTISTQPVNITVMDAATSMLEVKKQSYVIKTDEDKVNNGDDVDEVNVRFISSVDGLDYLEAGFVFALSNTEPEIGVAGCVTRSTTVVYKNLNTSTGSMNVEDVYPEGYEAGCSRYMFAHEFTGIPSGTTLYVRAYVKIEDDTQAEGYRIVYGETRAVTTDNTLEYGTE